LLQERFVRRPDAFEGAAPRLLGPMYAGANIGTRPGKLASWFVQEQRLY
jgi:hypothetical protein